MILALSLLACNTTTGTPVDPVDPVDPTPTAVPIPPLSELAVQSEHGEGHITFSDHGDLGGWSVDLAIVGAGREGLVQPTPVAPVVEDHRATYTYDGFTDWYQATDVGTKHGIDIAEQPEGTGNLRYVYQVSSELLPVQQDGHISFVDANGQVRFNYADIFTFDANGDEVPSWLELDCTDSCKISLVVDDSDATYPLTVDPLAFSNENVLVHPDGENDTNFGRSVDIDGTFAIVGAHKSTGPGGGNRHGEAFIYQRSGTSWNLLHTIAGTAPQDFCGWSVAISDDRVVIGCPGVDGPDNNTGVARVYTFDTSTVDIEAELSAPSATLSNQRMGWSVDINEAGNRAIVSGWGNNNQFRAGIAAIYERTGTSWSTPTEFSPLGTTARYGFSAGIGDDYAVVGAPDANSSDGQVFIYNRTGVNTWAQEATFDGNSSVGELGFAVAIDGTTAAVGAPRDAGAVNVYTRPTSTWVLQQTLIQDNSNTADRFGEGVGVEFNRIVVGATRDDSGTTDDRDVGSMIVYDRSGSFWTEQVEVLTGATVLNGNVDATQVGRDAAVSGSWIIGGSFPDNDNDLETSHLFRITECVAVTGQAGCDVDLVITELHIDPLGGDDEEFIELFNAGGSAVQLQGATVNVDGTPFTIDDSFVVRPNTHAIIAKSNDSSQNGGIAGVPGMYVDNTWTLDDAGAVSVVGTDASTLATMTYSGFATPAASLQLSHDGASYANPSASYTATVNGNWCPTFAPRVPGNNTFDFMSPRAVNGECNQVIDFDFFYDAPGTADDIDDDTFITLRGNRFTTGNSGEGDLLYTASASGQVMTIIYDSGVELDNSSSPRAFGDSCFVDFEADMSTFPPPNPTPGPNYFAAYETGDWDNMVCN